MKQQFSQIRFLVIMAALAVLAIPRANAYTVDEIVSSTKVPAIEAVSGSYVQRSLPAWSCGRLYVTKKNANTITVHGMFEGCFNLDFKITQSGSTTYATMVPDNGYTDKVASMNVGVNSDPESFYGNNTMKVYRGLLSDSWDAYYVDVCGNTVNAYGNYSEASQWRGTVTKREDGSFSIFFNQPVSLVFADRNYNALSKTLYYNAYQLVIFQPNATTTDTWCIYRAATSSMGYHNRQYSSLVSFFPGKKFTINNFGGFGNGIKAEQTNSNPNVSMTFNNMEGYYDLETGKVYMKRAPWITDIESVTANTSNVYGAVRKFELRQIDDPTKSSGLVTYERDLEGTMEVAPAHENENDLWAQPHGNLKTNLNATMAFEPFACYSPDLRSALRFRVANTRITIPAKDVTLKLAPAKLELKHDPNGNTSTNKYPCKANVVFYPVENDIFVSSYDIYLVKGNNVKGNDVIYLGNVPYESMNSDGHYDFTGTFYLETEDGRPWYEHTGENYLFNYQAKAVANYTLPQSISQTGAKKATQLKPTHHALGDASLNVTVGVQGIEADGNWAVEATEYGAMAKAPADVDVQVYNMAGMKVAAGKANTEIQLDAKGVFVVKVGDRTFKLVR